MTAPDFPFLPGLDLSEALYRKAALLGQGSEVLGFATSSHRAMTGGRG